MAPFFKKLLSPILWLNCLGMIVFVVIVIVGTMWGLSVYTHHGEQLVVPDVCRLPMAEARRVLAQAGLGIEVVDTGYVKELPMDCVIEQQPMAGEKVKEGHVIAIIVNASSTPTKELPDIIQNSSLREAVATLKSMGFKVGETEYVRGEKDWVYGITVDGRRRRAGDRIPVTKVVVVQAGNGYMELEDSLVYIDIDYEPIDEEDDDVDDFVELVE